MYQPLAGVIYHVWLHVSVLPPVLVPRNPQMITSVYEPVPSYLDSGRSTFSPNSDGQPLNYDTPGQYILMHTYACMLIHKHMLAHQLARTHTHTYTHTVFLMHVYNNVYCSWYAETPPPAYSEAGSPSPSDPNLMDQLSPSKVITTLTQIRFRSRIISRARVSSRAKNRSVARVKSRVRVRSRARIGSRARVRSMTKVRSRTRSRSWNN